MFLNDDHGADCKIEHKIGVYKMITTELIEKINLLNPEDYNMVVILIDRLSQNTYSFSKLSEDELVRELSQSIAESDSGFTKPARQISQEMRKKYGI